MYSKRLFELLLISLSVLTVLVTGLEAVVYVLDRTSFALWTANFVLLVVAVLLCVPLAVYRMYLSWQTTKSYLV